MAAKFEDKVVVLVDMDCFYVQVEKALNPELKGKPCAIVQYNKWKGGSIIAVDYEARKYGVTRSLKGDEAKLKCPDICLARVPEKRGKADLSNYRKASAHVMKVLSQFTSIIERASIDEAYLDLTLPVKTYINNNMKQSEFDYTTKLHATRLAGERKEEKTANDGNGSANNDTVSNEMLNSSLPEDDSLIVTTDHSLHERHSVSDWIRTSTDTNDKELFVGAILTQQIRDAVFAETGFTCSAGVSYNKMLAKLAAGMNKPNQQTILPKSQVDIVFSDIPFKKVRHLGGKLGQQVQEGLGISYVGQLQQYSLNILQDKFGSKTGLWLYEVCRGKCDEQLQNRTITKSIGCSKNFTGPSKLRTYKIIAYWLEQLCEELVERLEEDTAENSRKAQSVSVHFLQEGATSSLARTFQLPSSFDVKYLVSKSWEAINKGHKPITREDAPLTWTSGILNIHLSASKFVPVTKGNIVSLLSNMPLVSSTNNESTVIEQEDKLPECSSNNDQQCSENTVNITNFFTPMKRKQETVIDSFMAKKRELLSCSDDKDQLWDNQFDCTICSVCGDEIVKLLLEEHMDYHIAMTLHTPNDFVL